MSDSYTDRLEAVRTAIDAVIASMADGEYMTSYSVGDRQYSGESTAQLLRTLRAEESILIGRVAAESKTGGARSVVRFREPQ